MEVIGTLLMVFLKIVGGAFILIGMGIAFCFEALLTWFKTWRAQGVEIGDGSSNIEDSYFGVGKTIEASGGAGMVDQTNRGNWNEQPRPYKEITKNGDNLILVEKGSFKEVTLTYDFYIGKYPVTFEEYDRYCEEVGDPRPDDENWGRGRRPVINVTWWDAIAYFIWLSIKEGFPEAYDGDGSFVDALGRKTTDPKKVYGYRLPTEAEWAFAARGGKNSMGYEYSGSNNPDIVAWYEDNSDDQTHEVGQKKANELGLYDMSGNVWEWCSDWFAWRKTTPKTDPYNATPGSERVLRGGSWYDSAMDIRLFNDNLDIPDRPHYGFGFRIARTARLLTL